MRGGLGRPSRPFAGDVPPLLRRANQMLSAGNFAEAASTYEQLARAAEARGGPRAPLFYLQAGRGRVLAGQPAEGLELLQRGLGLFAVHGQQPRAANLGTRIVAELKARGLRREAAQIGEYLEELFPGFEAGPAEAALSPMPSLPAPCPACGAPLRPEEVDRSGDTAICSYCGSPVGGS